MIDIDQLKNSFDLRDYASPYLGEGTSSHDFDQYPCFSHSDDRPSLTVYSDHYHCFGCGAHGSIIDFRMEYFHEDYKTALEALSGNIPSSPRPIHPSKPTEPKKPSIPMSIVEQSFANLKVGLPYYEQRQISDDTSMLKKLGVKLDFPTVYKMKTGEEVWFKAKRYALPNVFAGQVRGINYRRDDQDFLKQFTFHPMVNQVMEDLEQRLGYFPEDSDILKHCGGPKYRQEKGSVSRVFNVDMIAQVKDGKVEKKQVNWLAIHAEVKEIDCLALMSLGFPVVGVSLSADLIPSLNGIFSHVPILYIIRDRDEVGAKKAEALQQILGRGRILTPPDGYKDSGEVAQDGMAFKWFDSFGLSPVLQGQY